jgi:hypothetical protein
MLGLGTGLSRESLEAVLKPTKRDQVQHFAWARTKNSALIVHAKSDAFKPVLIRKHYMVRQQLNVE